MHTIRTALTLVFSERRSILIGITAALLFGGVFVFASGMITFFPEGPFIEFNLVRLTTLTVLSVLAGLVVPLQWYAMKKARGGLKGGASSFGGMLTGIATMSCCAPLLLPALLSFVGFSGTQLLFLNITVRRYAIPLSFASILLLIVSLFLVSRSVTAACKLKTA